jgi:putative hydrolase of the HAD superfamily
MLSEAVMVLDLDDTLYLERDYVRSGLLAVDHFVREHLNITGFAEIGWRAFLDGRRGDLFDHALAELSVPAAKAEIARLVDVYRNHPPRITMPADSEHLLASVAPMAIRTGLISDGPLAAQSAKIQALGLVGRLHELICTDRWGPAFWKPHARAYLVFRALEPDLPADRFVYVADNPRKDFTAALALGWWTVRIARPGGLHTMLPDDLCPVHRRIESLDEIRPERLVRGQCP